MEMQPRQNSMVWMAWCMNTSDRTNWRGTGSSEGQAGSLASCNPGSPTPTSSSSWSPGHAAFSSSEFWLATDTSGWPRSPALSSSWRWEQQHQQTHRPGGLSRPGRDPPRPVHTPPLPLPAVAASETGGAGASGAGTAECPAAARAPWPGPGPPEWTAPPPAREGRESGRHAVPGAQGACPQLLRRGPSRSRDAAPHGVLGGWHPRLPAPPRLDHLCWSSDLPPRLTASGLHPAFQTRSLPPRGGAP